MRVALSILFWGFFILSAVPMFVGALVVFLLTFPFDYNRRWLHLYSCAWAQMSFWINPLWKLHIEGREKLPKRGAAVIVSNHESLGDILVLYGLYRPFKWVSKRSVFNVPFVGWNMWLNGYVGVVRGQRESVVKMLDACRAWLKRGVPILLFPEGTRSVDGQVKAFKDGAFTLATEQQCRVYPIALSGTGRTLPKHGFVIRELARCHARVLDPVDPKAFGGDVAALREHVRSLIIAAKAEMGDPNADV